MASLATWQEAECVAQLLKQPNNPRDRRVSYMRWEGRCLQNTGVVFEALQLECSLALSSSRNRWLWGAVPAGGGGVAK